MKKISPALLLAVLCFILISTVRATEYPIGRNYPPTTDFKAQWITAPDCPAIPNLWFNFRKSFDLKEAPKKALCRIAADSKYWLYVNGELAVFEGGLKRGPSPKDTCFDEVDLKPFLKKGKNTIAILLWYFGKSGFSHLDSGKPGLVFDATGNGTDGLNLISDGSWKVNLYSGIPQGLTLKPDRKRSNNLAALPKDWRARTFGPFEAVTADPQPNYRLSEWNIRFDARYDYQGDWKSINFNDSAWKKAVVCGVPGKEPVEPWGLLFKRITPLWKDFGLKDYPKSKAFPFTTDKQITIECPLPYNAQVTPYFEITAPAGLTIDIRTENYKGGSEYNVRTEYVTKKGVQQFETPGWMNGHRVQYTFPAGVTVQSLKYRETGFNTEFAGSFKCDDPFFNLLWEKAARTLYITMRDTFFDCPDRERAQWLGDAVNELGEAFYCMDRNADTLPKKAFYELYRFQRADNTIFSPVPGNYTSELPAQMLAISGWYGLGTYSHYSGDFQTGMDLYNGIKRYESIWEFDDQDLIKVRKGAWSWGDWGQDVDLRILLNCWYYLLLKETRQIALRLDLQADANVYAAKMKRIEGAFNKVFWTGKDYRDPQYKGRSDDRANAMAVLAGFAKPEWYPILRKHFLAEKNASPYMEKYVLEALFFMGYPDDGLKRMKERFAKMVNHPDYSTLWEGWGIGSEGYGGGTVNHAWSGGGLTALAQYAVGLTPVEPAFKTFKIVPQPGFLKKIEMKTCTHFGTFEIKYQKSKREFKIDVKVPEGTSGVLYVPCEYKNAKADIADAEFFAHHFTGINLKPGTYSFSFPAVK